MSDEFFERYGDVLQNIEFAIVSVYRERPELADSNVDRVLENLVRIYTAESRQRPVPNVKLNELDTPCFDRVREMCEWRLGRAEGPQSKGKPARLEPKSFDEIVACLKRIRSSVKLWTNKGGRQGYLEYVSQFIV